MNQLQKLFHKHHWVRIYGNRFGNLDQCLKCDEYQTWMQDKTIGRIVAVPGNFVYRTKGQVLYVVTGNYAQFTVVKKDIIEHFKNIEPRNIRYVSNLEMMAGISLPEIVFYGTWWENEVTQTPEFARILNVRAD